MTDQATSIRERLCQAGSPLRRREWEWDDGYYVAACRVSPADIPQLIEIACQWSDCPGEDFDRVGDSVDSEFLPVTAWRALADLKCSESVEPLIGMLGNRAESLFSKSKEADQFVECFGELRWLRSFLGFGIQHLGESVDAMTLASVEEYVFGYVPRQVSTAPKSAASIILELTKFWEYVHRVFDLPAAKSIVDWLSTDGLVDRLETAVADTENFGMAKSLVMAGNSAGFDMTSERGAAAFMAAFNRSQQPSVEAAPPGTVVSSQSRVGRNDPCPCGSGKKYKKCCLRRA